MEISKITLDIKLLNEKVKLIEEYYYKGDSLIFIYKKRIETKVYRSEDGVWETVLDETVFEGRYYIQGNQIIKSIEEGNVGAYSENELEILQFSESLQKVMIENIILPKNH